MGRRILSRRNLFALLADSSTGVRTFHNGAERETEGNPNVSHECHSSPEYEVLERH